MAGGNPHRDRKAAGKKNHLTCCVRLWRGRDHGLGPTLGSRKACQLSLEEGLSDRQHGEERRESKRVYRARHVSGRKGIPDLSSFLVWSL